MNRTTYKLQLRYNKLFNFIKIKRLRKKLDTVKYLNDYKADFYMEWKETGTILEKVFYIRVKGNEVDVLHFYNDLFDSVVEDYKT